MNLKSIRTIGALSVVLGLLTIADGTAAQRRPVWERVDQFIAVERQDSAALPNDHPVQLSTTQLRATLAPLQVIMERGDEPIPLFTRGELDTLSEGLASALGSATPAEDATFAIVGLHGAVLGLFKQPMVTTGRVFYRQGALNLILGQVHEPVNDRDDRRLKPFLPGLRTTTTSHSWRLAAKSGKALTFGDGRTDWVLMKPVLDIPAPPQSDAEETGLSRPSPPQAPAGGARGIEERLKLLRELHNKNLITDEEYQAKRKEILSGI